MGIWAPLEIRRQTSETLWLSSGWGTLKLGLGLVAFGLTVFIMRELTRAFSNPAFTQDPFLITFLPLVLTILAPLLLILGTVVLGYRKDIFLKRDSNHFLLSKKIWFVPVARRGVRLAQIKEWRAENKVPKRYQPEQNKLKRPVGYWRLFLVLDNGENWCVDEAPRQDEILGLKKIFEEYLPPKTF